MGRPGPALCLVAYGAAFAVAALGPGVPAADHHPEQLFRLWHALERSLPHGAWTADWNPDWWGGFPELQFFPPGLALAGAAIRLLGFWQLSVELVYELACALVLLLPGLTTFALVRSALGSGWLALPPAFLALTLSAGLPGGVEGFAGGFADRLGLGLLPLLVLALRRWVEDGRPPLGAPPAVAALILADPSTTTVVFASLCATVLATAVRGKAAGRQALTVAALGLGLTAAWSLPRLVRAPWAVELTAGDPTFAGILHEMGARPFLLGITGAALVGFGAVLLRRRLSDAFLATLPWSVAAVAFIGGPISRGSRLVVEPGWLLDDFILLATTAAGLGVGALVLAATARRKARRTRPFVAFAIIGAVVLASTVGRDATPREPDLTLWPARARWPTLEEVSRRSRLPDLWAALKPGSDRVLFLAAAIPLDHAGRLPPAPSRVLSLAPYFTGREIVDGTSAHPSRLAARLYTGSQSPPVRLAVPRAPDDDRRLLGEPWDRLAPRIFDAFARRLRIATVVVPSPEAGRARFLGEAYVLARETAGFSVFERRDRPWPRLDRITHRRFRVFIEPTGGVWIPTGIPAYPLWQVKSPRGRLETRVDPWGLLEFRVPIDVFEAELVYAESWLEWGSLALTLAAGSAWLVWARRARRRAPAFRRGSTRPFSDRRRRHD